MKKTHFTTIVVLIPAYQPGEELVKTTDHLVDEGFSVVVVDDGSGEKYSHVFDKIDSTVRQLHHGVNKGKGAALKTGLWYIQKHFPRSIVVTADADGQHRVEDIRRLANAYRTHSGELLLGVRTFDQNDVPLRSRFGNVVTRQILALVTKQSISDTQTGLRAFDTGLVDMMCGVTGDRFEYETNVLLECSRSGVEVAEVPIATVYENGNQQSHFRPVTDSWAIYKEIIKFASSSLAAFFVDFLLFWLLLWVTRSWVLSTSVMFANVTARVVSAGLNYGLNRQFVFRFRGPQGKGVLQYALLAGSILTANTVLLTLLTSTFGVAAVPAKIGTELVMFSASYLVQRTIIFSKKEVSRV